jgi:tetratricopeptide (TPR) repeat protein
MSLEDVQKSLRCLYWFYDVRGQLAEGAAAFHKAVVKLKAAGCTGRMHNQVTGHCLAVEGWFEFRLGKFAKARNLLNDSLKLLETAPGSLALNEARAFLGALSYITGEYGQAIELLGHAIEYGKTSGDHWLTAHALGSLGRVAQLSGNYIQAYAMFKDSLDFWERIGDLRGRTYALAYLGNIEVSLGEYSQANQHLLLSLELSRATGDAFSIGTALNHLGLLAYKRADYLGSIASYEQSVSLFELLGEQASLGWVCNNLGHSQLALGQFEQAAARLQDAMQIARQSQIVPLMLDTLVGWGIIQAQAEAVDQIASMLAGIARHPASTQSVRERVGLALLKLGFTDSEQALLVANAPEISPKALIDQALESGLTFTISKKG